jgi:cytochrome c553
MKRTMILAVLVGFASMAPVWAGDGKDNYEHLCAKCHGPDGKGQTKIGEKLAVKDFTDAKVQGEFTDEAALKAIKEGVKRDGRTAMKPFENLSDDDAKALVQVVRGFKK